MSHRLRTREAVGRFPRGLIHGFPMRLNVTQMCRASERKSYAVEVFCDEA